jgi:transglutaminase-like putative cysteine protease
MKRFLLLFILLVPIASASWYLNAEEVVLDMEISGGFELRQDGSGARATYATVNQSFYPKEDFRQDVVDFSTSPSAQENDGMLIYRWDDPAFGSYDYTAQGEVHIKNLQNKVRRKIPFPVRNLPAKVMKYTEPSETADSKHPSVFSLANELAAGEDDLFVVVHNLATWTKYNIEYNLSTLTADVSEKASWVLANRYGVCDEMTNLFIALARSIGIPAKFVSGISYTESELFSEPWGPHGWAEVYFPGVGWVAYDVTYGQLGFIDPTHVKLQESIDASDSSVNYNWLGRNVQLLTKPLDVSTTLVRHTGLKADGMELSAVAIKEGVGFDSYNGVKATIRNTKIKHN